MNEPDYVLSTPATADLEEIHHWIARDDPAAAVNVLTDLRDAVQRLATMPGLGHARDDLADETLRLWTVHSYLVIYRPGGHHHPRGDEYRPFTAASNGVQ